MTVIPIQKYDIIVDKLTRQIRYFAVISDKERIEMPACYADMYNEDHLAIQETKVDLPELFDLPETASKHYIPLDTRKEFSCPKTKAKSKQ